MRGESGRAVRCTEKGLCHGWAGELGKASVGAGNFLVATGAEGGTLPTY